MPLLLLKQGICNDRGGQQNCLLAKAFMVRKTV
jgi:hypothetical protein